MGIGTDSGEYYDDKLEYLINNARGAKADKQFRDAKEINTNSTSGDFQSRFYATDQSTMPLGASTELAGALKRTGSTKVPGEEPETKIPSIGPPLIPDGGQFSAGTKLGNAAATVLSHKLYDPIEHAVSFIKMVGDASQGKAVPTWAMDETGEVRTDLQTIEKSNALAGLLIGGPSPVAAKLADGSLGSFAGVKSRTLPRDKLYEAQNLELDMMHPDDIWNKTGFFRGADRRWRYEIPDKDVTLKMDAFDVILDPLAKPNKNTGATGGGWTNIDTATLQGDKIVPKSTIPNTRDLKSTEDWISWIAGKGPRKPLTLDKVLDHPELFKAYPELATLKVERLPESIEKTGIKGTLSGDTIYLAEGHPEYIKSVVLHELQHGIQRHEGFAFGGAPSDFLPKELPQAEKEFLAIKQAKEPNIADRLGSNQRQVNYLKDVIRSEQEGTIDLPWFKDTKIVVQRFKENHPEIYRELSNIVKSERLIKQAKDEAYTKYTRLMGEVEARNVQARMNYDWRARHTMEPSRTEDTPRMVQTKE